MGTPHALLLNACVKGKHALFSPVSYNAPPHTHTHTHTYTYTPPPPPPSLPISITAICMRLSVQQPLGGQKAAP